MSSGIPPVKESMNPVTGKETMILIGVEHGGENALLIGTKKIKVKGYPTWLRIIEDLILDSTMYYSIGMPYEPHHIVYIYETPGGIAIMLSIAEPPKRIRNAIWKEVKAIIGGGHE